jgi:excisionase family DNA binding protein
MQRIEQDLMTVNEAAAFLRVRASWIYSRTRGGDFPVVKLGGHIRVPRRELIEWVNERRVKAA